MKYRGTIKFILLPVMATILFSCKGDEVPSLTTSAVYDILVTTAVSGGTINDEGDGPVIEKGLCWNAEGNPTLEDNITTVGSGSGSFSSNITGLLPGEIYYVRAYATNEAGTGYGVTIKFSTQVADGDGNLYKTVEIENQVWLEKNLKTTKYNDGTEIAQVTDDAEWQAASGGAYSWYGNDSEAYKDLYGGLYNYQVVSSGKICPDGWHVPTDNEWTALTNNIGGEAIAGGNLKTEGTADWLTPNTGGNNVTGFNALPGGIRDALRNGGFYDRQKHAYFWSSTASTYGTSWYRLLKNDDSKIVRSQYDMRSGMSIRCIKDQE